MSRRLNGKNMPGWKIIADAINDAVESSGLPVATIAKSVGVTRQYIYSMMDGSCNPSIDKIEKLFKAVDLSFENWLNDRALYGKDKRLHDQLQFVLNHRGANAVAIRRTLEALISLKSDI